MVIIYEGRHGADLDGVGVVGRIFKKTIVGVEELPGHQEKELSGRSTVVQSVTHIHTHIVVTCCGLYI